MSELLNKKTKKLSSIKTPIPESVFSRSSLFTVNETPIKEKKRTTTIRCTIDTADKINALSILLDHESVNNLLEYAIKKIISELSDSEKKELLSIESVYSKKRKFKEKR